MRARHGDTATAAVRWRDRVAPATAEFWLIHPGAATMPARPAHQPGDTWNPDRGVWERDPWPCGHPVDPVEGVHDCERSGGR